MGQLLQQDCENAMLAIQLILSFFLGGVSVAILSVVAENTNERVSGIVMMLPTTIVIGFGCLAWTTSAAVVAEVAPATIVPLGLLVFSIAIYVCTSRFSRLASSTNQFG